MQHLNIFFLNLFLPRKLQDLLGICPFSFVYFLCVGIPILKIVLSHAHMWVSSDVIPSKIIFSLIMSSPIGPDIVNGEYNP